MSSNRSLHRALAVFLLAVLLLAGLPAQARPLPREVAALGENGLARVWNLFVSLWQRANPKEGTSIDPNGGQSDEGDEGVTIDPDGVNSEEGTSIDPDGRP
jgi:hypothetical protein